MQMLNGLARLSADIQHESVALFLHPQLLGQHLSAEKELSQ
jgi:hypothetical protein